MAWRDVIQGGPALPAFLGAELEPYPYISGYGLLRRMTQLGRLMGVELTALGIRNRVTSDALTATQRPGAPKAGLLHALGLRATRVGDYWSPEVWSPLRTGRVLERHNLPLRDCPLCAAHGYHCALFQLPFIDHCPWHAAKLRTGCPQCDRTCWARFHSDLRLGRCECGYDAFEVRTASINMWHFPAAEVDAWASRYLDWAAEERKSRLFVVPSPHTDWMPGYAALARQSLELKGMLVTAQPTAELEEFSDVGEDPPRGEFWGWSLLGGERPMTFVPLPATMHVKLTQATWNAVTAFPSDTPTPFEFATLNGLDEGQTLQQNLVNRPEYLIAPHGFSSDQRTWLNLSAVDPTAAYFCGELLDRVISSLEVHDDGCSRSLQAARSNALDGIAGRRHVAGALEAILVRAYTQGLETVLRSMMAAGKASKCQRWSLPTAEIVIANDVVRSVRVCWTPTRSPPSRRTVDTAASTSPATKAKTGSKASAARQRIRKRPARRAGKLRQKK